MFDAVEKALGLEEIVSKGPLRRYYRFRGARWYGGISTGDVTGCNLLCKFCWARDEIRHHPDRAGRLYTPEEAFRKLTGIARGAGFKQIRLSGQEPTIGRTHLLELLQLLDDTPYSFILETNGILIGHDETYAAALASFKNLHVRVSIKGTSEDEFSHLTGADPAGFALQLKGLENLVRHNVSCHAAVMISFSSKEGLRSLRDRLRAIDRTCGEKIFVGEAPSGICNEPRSDIAVPSGVCTGERRGNRTSSRLSHELEIEELIAYPHVVARLEKTRLPLTGTSHSPGNVPPELV